MQIRGLLIGIVALALLGGGFWWSEKQQKEKEDAPAADTAKLVTLKDEEVNRIEIVRGAEPPTVLEKDKSGWRITAPEPLSADADAVSSLVSAFTGLTQDRLIEEKAADLAVFGLTQPAVKVTVNGKRTLLLGDDTPTGGGVYAKLDGDAKVFTLASAVKSSFEKSAGDLRDKRLITIDDAKVARIELTAKGGRIAFGRNARNEWQIVEPKPLRADNLSVEELLRKAKDARIDNAAAPDPAAAAAPKIADLNLVGGERPQTLTIRKKGEDYFASSTEMAGVHRIDKALGEAVNKGVEDFRNKKIFDFGFNEPSKLSLIWDAKRYDFVKGGEKWWSNGKLVDSASVQQVIDRLRDLAATGFVEAVPTGAAFAEVSVTAADAKSAEKVSLYKSGADILARREGEATVYKLDASATTEIQKAAADVKPPPPPTQGGGK